MYTLTHEQNRLQDCDDTVWDVLQSARAACVLQSACAVGRLPTGALPGERRRPVSGHRQQEDFIQGGDAPAVVWGAVASGFG